MKTYSISIIVIMLVLLASACGPGVPTPTPGPGSTRVSEKDGMELVYVPAGEFLMGSVQEEGALAQRDQLPQHAVTLDAFWMDRTPVTNAMFARCVEERKCMKPASVNYSLPDFADHPVVSVTWEEAGIYCEWAGRRLPTEAEWEKAARGTDARAYPWGNEAPESVVGTPTTDPGVTIAVGSVAADVSPYSVTDLFTNVRTWQADWYDENYYAVSPSDNPKGPSAAQAGQKVARGGGWGGPPGRDRLANRRSSDPAARSAEIGIRCALTP